VSLRHRTYSGEPSPLYTVVRAGSHPVATFGNATSAVPSPSHSVVHPQSPVPDVDAADRSSVTADGRAARNSSEQLHPAASPQQHASPAPSDRCACPSACRYCLPSASSRIAPAAMLAPYAHVAVSGISPASHNFSSPSLPQNAMPYPSALCTVTLPYGRGRASAIAVPMLSPAMFFTV